MTTPGYKRFYFTPEEQAIAHQARREADRLFDEFVRAQAPRPFHDWRAGYRSNPPGPSAHQVVQAHEAEALVDPFLMIDEFNTNLRQAALLRTYPA